MNINDTLRKQIEKTKPFPDGTVVRFKRNYSTTVLTYAALAVQGSWYLTGTRSERKITHWEFLEFLSRKDVWGIEVATEWQEV